MKKVVVLFLSLILIVGLSMPTFALADTSLETTTSQAEFFSFAYDDMTNEIAYHIRNGEKRFTVVREVKQMRLICIIKLRSVYLLRD